jgi:hypothetical protein
VSAGRQSAQGRDPVEQQLDQRLTPHAGLEENSTQMGTSGTTASAHALACLVQRQSLSQQQCELGFDACQSEETAHY